MAQLRICVIEDNDNFRSALVDRLTSEQYPTQGFVGIEDFFSALCAPLPDIIVSDVFMADGDGFDLIKRLHNSGLNIPVILMSSSSEFSLARRAHDMGARAFLRKPFEFSHLCDALRQA